MSRPFTPRLASWPWRPMLWPARSVGSPMRAESDDHPSAPLPVVRQCYLLALPRSSVYCTPQRVLPANLAPMRQFDELHLRHPFAGSRMLRNLLRLQGMRVGRKYVATLMRRMGMAAPDRHPRTTQPHPGHQVFLRWPRWSGT
jgi:hypothetical protein